MPANLKLLSDAALYLEPGWLLIRMNAVIKQFHGFEVSLARRQILELSWEEFHDSHQFTLKTVSVV